MENVRTADGICPNGACAVRRQAVTQQRRRITMKIVKVLRKEIFGMHGRRSLSFNAEGYSDPTVYLALNKRGKEMDNWKDGDVIKETFADGSEQYKVLVKCHKNYGILLQLFDSPSREHEHEIEVNGNNLHADLGKIRYSPSRNIDLCEHVRTLNDEEYLNLLRGVGEALGLQVSDAEKVSQQNTISMLKANCASMEAVIDEKNTEIEQLLAEVQNLKNAASYGDPSVEMVKAVTERDIYKEMCMKLMDKIGYGNDRPMVAV